MLADRGLVSVALALAFAAGIGLAWAGQAVAEQPARPSRPSRWASHLPPGSQAPDFHLARLIVQKHDDGRWTGRIGNKNETVRLSAFRGKRPACLFFSSYT